MFDLPDELLGVAIMNPPNGVNASFSTSSPDQIWYFITVPLCSAIPAIFIALHLYAKIHLVRRMDLADYFIVIAFICLLVNLSCGRVAVSWGIGAHLWNLRLKEYMHLRYWFNVCEVLYSPTVFFIKAAIILQYVQILAPIRTGNEVMFYGNWGILVSFFIFCIIDVFTTLFMCYPREGIWNPLARARCLNDEATHFASVTINILSDLIVLLLPIRSVWKLRIKLTKKFWISLLFGMGLLATLASAMRVIHIHRIYHPPPHLSLPDASYELAWLGLWSWAELALGIMVACSLSLPKIYRAKWGRSQAKELSDTRTSSPSFTFSWSFPGWNYFAESEDSLREGSKKPKKLGEVKGARSDSSGDLDVELLVPKAVACVEPV